MLEAGPRRRGVLVAVLCFQSLLALLYLLDLSDVVYFPTIRRVTYTRVFDLGFDPFGGLVVAAVFWLVYMLLLGWWREALWCLIPFLFSVFSLGGSVALCVVAVSAVIIHRGGWVGEAVGWVLWILVGFYGVVLVHWLVLYPFGLGGWLVWFADLEVKLFHVGSYFAPLLGVTLLVVWFVKPVSERVIGRVEVSDVGSVRVSGRSLLVLSVLVGVLAAVYPYFPPVNPSGGYVGVDAVHYEAPLRSVEADIMNVFSVTQGGRPFFYLVLRLFQVLTFSSVERAIKFLPVILVPALGVSSYYFMGEVSGDPCVAGWAAFFSVTGVKTVVGMYSYFLSNLLGLTLIQLSLGLLFSASKAHRVVRLVGSGLFAALCLYTHPWTFDQYVIPLIVLMGLLVVFKIVMGGPGFDFRGLVVVLLLLVFAEVFMMRFSRVSATDLFVRLVLNRLSIDRISSLTFAGLWSSVLFGFRLRYGEYMSHVLLILFAVIGVYTLRNVKNGERYLTVLLALTFACFCISEKVVMSRLFYNLPLEGYAALGFVGLHSKQGARRSSTWFMLTYSLVYLFRSLANMII